MGRKEPKKKTLAKNTLHLGGINNGAFDGQKVSLVFFFAALILSLASLMTPAAQAEECPLFGQHQFGTYVYFEADHPHRQYVLCDCGYAKYTGGTQYYSECEICNPKDYVDIQTVPVELAVLPQAEECPVHGQHQFGTYVQFEADHPHKQYVVCDCGYTKYTGGTQYYSECEICNPKEPAGSEMVTEYLPELEQEQQQTTHPDDDARMSEEYKTSVFYKQLKEGICSVVFLCCLDHSEF